MSRLPMIQTPLIRALALAIVVLTSTTAFTQTVVTLTGTLDFEQTHSGNSVEVTVPLSGSASLEGLSCVVVEGWRIESARSPGPGSWGILTNVRLLDGVQEKLFMNGIQVASAVDEIEMVARVLRYPPPLSPGVANAVRIRVACETGAPDAPYTTRVVGIHPGSQIRCHFVYESISPSGPHDVDTFLAVLPSFSSPMSPWQTEMFSTPVPAAAVRLIATDPFEVASTSPSEAVIQIHVLLSDGSFIALDDETAPSLLGSPTATSFTNSLWIDDDTIQDLLGLDIVGYRWRMRLASSTAVGQVFQHSNRIAFFRDVQLPLQDCNENDIPDEYEPDLDGDGFPDDCRPFIRGRCNADDTLDLADAIFLLGVLFGDGSSVPPCESACDFSDDGLLNLADPILALSALIGGDTIPAPTVDCSVDPTIDSLTCDTFSCP